MRLGWLLGLGLLLGTSTSSTAWAEEPAGEMSETERNTRLEEIDQLQAEFDRLFEQGLLSECEAVTLRLLALREETLGPEHQDTLLSMLILAYIYQSQGRYTEAEPLYRRELEASEHMFGPEDPSTLISLNNLAKIYSFQGRYAEAEPLYLRALEAQERTLGPEHPDTLVSMSNLAGLYSDQDRYDEAETLYLRDLEASERTLGTEHPHTLTGVHNLALLYKSQGRYAEAEPLYLRALEASERTLGPEHPETLISVNNLAGLHHSQGRYAEAEPLYLRALEAQERTVGPEHPGTLASVANLALLYLKTHRFDTALPLAQRMADGEEAELSRNFGSSESSRQTFFDTLSGSTHFILSLHLDHAPDSAEALELAFETWLRRKGRVLDIQSDTLARLRRNLDDEGRALLDSLSRLRTDEAAFVAAPPEEGFEAYREQLDDFAQQIQEKERLISVRSQAFAIQTEPVTIDSIRQRLPDGVALLQYVVYEPQAVDEGDDESPHLAAYLLHADGRISGLKLTPMSELEPLLSAFRLDSFRQTLDPKDAQALYDSLIAPILDDPGELTHLLISPDGPLNLIAFEALQDAQGTSLIETVSLSYLSTGRDLMRLSIDEEFELSPPLVIAAPDYQFELSPPLVIASPDYQTEQVASSWGGRGIGAESAGPAPEKGMVGVSIKISEGGQLRVDLTVKGGAAAAAGVRAGDVIQSIDGTTTKGKSIEQCLELLAGPPGAPVELQIYRARRKETLELTIVRSGWIGPQPVATTAYQPIGFSSLPPPEGWKYLDGAAEEAQAISETVEDAIVLTGPDATADALRAVDSPRFLHVATHGFSVADDPDDPRDDNPMVRSGLVFAGANQGNGADTLLLASEAASLDLDGTRLVVLSACGSGLGDTANGEGVYGMRRALQLAGSRSQVVSLWEVDDTATMEFMTGFYGRLEGGQGMSEALRETKLEMMRSEEYGEPFYWAPFVLAGDWI
jgi:CHAT domain-containing protein/Tfp pilus assembly protein PilF